MDGFGVVMTYNNEEIYKRSYFLLPTIVDEHTGSKSHVDR